MRYLVLFLLKFTLAEAAIIDEGMLLAAKSVGDKVYYTCIVTPPVTPGQEASCIGLYEAYNASLMALNAPLPLVWSVDPDPYLWSPFDICRYETGHMVFGEQTGVPYCPTL